MMTFVACGRSLGCRHANTCTQPRRFQRRLCLWCVVGKERRPPVGSAWEEELLRFRRRGFVRADESTVGTCIVVPGKFDTLHLGHRALAHHAAEWGYPVLMLTFSGLRETLGLPPRLPIVAPGDEIRILDQWSRETGRKVSMKSLNFSDVRHLAPEQFLDRLRKELGAHGVVSGSDWRFGFKAEGNIALLQQYAAGHDWIVETVEPVHDMDSGEIISSTKIRALIERGNMIEATRLLGRPHRLFGSVVSVGDDPATSFEWRSRNVIGNFVNLFPPEGIYDVEITLEGDLPSECTSVEIVCEKDQSRVLALAGQGQRAWSIGQTAWIDFV